MYENGRQWDVHKLWMIQKKTVVACFKEVLEGMKKMASVGL
jgi:hypothetical protein